MIFDGHLPLTAISTGFAITGLVLGYLILCVILDPCRSVPGPLIARFTKLWNVYRVARGDYEVTNNELRSKYGPVVRVQPGQYIIDDVGTINAMFQVSGPTWLKDKWHLAWNHPPPAPAGLFSDTDPVHHAAQRRKVSSLYSMSSIKGYELFVDDSVKVLKARFLKAAQSNETIDLADLSTRYAFDVVSSITFGERFGTLDKHHDTDELFKSIDQRTIYSTFAGFYPWVHPWLYPQIVKRTRSGWVYNFCQSRVASVREALRTGKATSEIKAQPFVARLLNMQTENPKKITEPDIYATALSNVFAGADTTATSLCGIFYHLIRNPRVLAKARQEIDEAVAEGRVSNPISFTESENLLYLQACIKEAMRLHRAGALPLNREVPASGVQIQGYYFPEGTVLGANVWALHRNKKIFGDDAEFYRPERWLEFAQTEGKLAEVEASTLIFGRGSRSCIGKHIAMIEIEKVIPEIIRHFDFEVIDWAKVEKVEGGLKTRGWQFAKVMSFEAAVKQRV